ncbi:MAG: prepilin-type N-terminal cleavage/methylation domain-containing protein [Lysobacterales bacterium]
MLNIESPFILTMRRSGGFTLIELMIVISIIAILVTLAIPAYQEYNIRAKITECMVGAAPAKLAVSEYMSTVGSWPPDMDAAALSSGNVSKFCSGFDGYDPAVGSFQINVNEMAIYPTLGQVQPQLTPQVTSVTTIAWRCSRGATAPGLLKYLPSTCRGT